MAGLLQDLNEKQREAVTAPLGPVLILAGAGSGKTRALTYRLAWLLEQGWFRPEEILALTFTNKAAEEMKHRVQALLGDRRPETGDRTPTSGLRVTMGTFHSVCARILRKEFSPNFIIYDEEDRLKVIKQILLEQGLGDEFRPQVFGYYISQAKNRLLHPQDLELGREFFQQVLDEVYELYQGRLSDSNALDFDDLLAVTARLFRSRPRLLKKYQTRFQYVLVDEYQDTNHAQYILLKLLTEEHRNIFVVGDDAQSIYGFRGANLRNLLDFKKDYPEARVIMLERNYRSTQNILDAANQIIRLNPFQYEKNLWTKNSKGEKVFLFAAESELEEAEFVVNRIMNQELRIKQGGSEPVYVNYEQSSILEKFMKSRKVESRVIHNSNFVIPDNLREQVILYRTHAQSRAFEEALMTSGIPYQIIGGVKFYERREIKDTLAYLRLVFNPKDLVSLARVVNLPARGIGSKAFSQLSAAFKKYQFSFKRLHNNLSKLNLPDKTLSGASRFFGLMLEAGHLPERKNILELADLLLNRSGYKEALLDGSEEGFLRWDNIEELLNVAGKYRQLPWRFGLGQFLEEVALMTDLDRMEEAANRLTLMTLHSAKGLEFDRVFLVGLEEGLLPHSRSLNEPEELAEEIRLAYVGMTRARKNLFLSWAKRRSHFGELRPGIPSRVIKAIPEKLIQRLSN